MSFSNFKVGDHVAILPAQQAPPTEVLDIAKVVFAGKVLVQLEDGRRYSNNYGYALDEQSPGHIVPATDQHRKALSTRTKRDRVAAK